MPHWLRIAALLTAALAASGCGHKDVAGEPKTASPAVSTTSMPVETTASQVTSDVAVAELQKRNVRLVVDSSGGKVREASLNHDNGTDEAMKWLAALPSLEKVDLARTPISDAGLAHLKNLTNLRVLILTETAVSDAGLAWLKKLSRLEELQLRGTRVTDAGLAHVEPLRLLQKLAPPCSTSDAGLKHLHWLLRMRELNLSGCAGVTDRGLSILRRMTGLQELLLDRTAVSDAGLAPLENLPALTKLGLRGTRVSDAGFASLGRLTALRWLDLSGTGVSGSELGQLGKLTRLQVLQLADTAVNDAALLGLHCPSIDTIDLSGTKVSDEGIKKFRPQAPECTIYR